MNPSRFAKPACCVLGRLSRKGFHVVSGGVHDDRDRHRESRLEDKREGEKPHCANDWPRSEIRMLFLSRSELFYYKLAESFSGASTKLAFPLHHTTRNQPLFKHLELQHSQVLVSTVHGSERLAIHRRPWANFICAKV